MKKICTVLAIVLVLIGVSVYFFSGPRSDSSSEPDLTSEVSNTYVRGVITGINGEQAMVDGPYLLSIRDEKGVESIISVPSRGFQLCAAKDSISSPYDLKEGMTVEANGALTSGGDIVPCESASHYLRVLK
jgi:hypothetical protein